MKAKENNMNREFKELADELKRQVVLAVDKYSPVLGQRIGAAMEDAFNCVSLLDYDPLEVIPKSLRGRLKRPAAFVTAFNDKHIEYKNGVFVNNFPNLYMLAAFLGHCFEDDRLVQVGRKKYLKGKKGKFPEKDLNELFDVHYLSNYRSKMIKMEFSARYKDFEYLMVM